MLKPNWRESIDRVEKELTDCLAALDRYEQSFHTVLQSEPAPGIETPNVLDNKTAGWSERLAKAGERAASVEQLLAEQEAIWERWQSAVVRWKESLRRIPNASA
ncbi:MAG: hypothetical protein U0798_07045 [Gemmataceae bacterium]